MKKIRNMSRALVPLLAVAMTAGCIAERHDAGANLGPGDRVPDFSVVMDDGSVFSSSSLEGTPSCIVFFNTGCPDCAEVLPSLQALYTEFGEDVCFVCISREEGGDEVSDYWKSHSYTMPYSAQESRAVYLLFASERIPRIYLSDSDMVIRHVFHDDPLPAYAQLLEALEGLYL